MLDGPVDIYQVAGINDNNDSLKNVEIYEPFWFRTFRFVQLKIETAQEPLTLVDFSFRNTAYPLKVTGNFTGSDDSFKPLWDISLQTLKCCMHETYEDCPYYEQLQYSMDTGLQMLFTYNISSDDRLARKAIHDLHSSKLPSGILQSRSPSVAPQVIPGFSLYWILMVYNHYLYFADERFVRQYLPTIEGVLYWFERHLTTDGLVDKLPADYWSWVDWTEEWNNNSGVPTAEEYGPITIYSLMYITALKKAAELYSWLGRRDMAAEFAGKAEYVKKAVKNNCYSPEKAYFRDGPVVEEYSQHVQIWSILSETITDDEAKVLLEKTLTDNSLSQVSYSMSFYLFRALAKVGLYDESFPLWDMWRDMVKLNLTTWAESPSLPRSDCHAWGAVPLYEFPAEILGVKPGKPGYKEIRIKPHPGPLKYAKGTVITCQGPVKVDWQIDNEHKFTIEVVSPADIPVELILPDNSTRQFNGNGLYSCPVK